MKIYLDPLNREHSLNIYFGDFTAVKDESSVIARSFATSLSALNNKKCSTYDDTTTAMKPSPASSSSIRCTLPYQEEGIPFNMLDEVKNLKSQFLMSQDFVASIPEYYFSPKSSEMEFMVI
jgi:hypothetical protein